MPKTPLLPVLVGFLLSALPAFGATYYVKNGGNDGKSGLSAAEAWQTLQHAADTVAAGDVVVVLPGHYQGFNLVTSGTTGAPITFTGNPGVAAPNPLVIIDGNNSFTGKDRINLEGPSHVVIEGFTVLGTGDPATSRACIRAVGLSPANPAAFVTVRYNRADRGGKWGIFSGFVDDMLVAGNEASRSAEEHGIYLSNSSDRHVIRDNVVWGNHSCGIHLNGDASMGGDGVMSGLLIERNILFDNGNGSSVFGPPGGSTINCDGVVNSVIRNNLLYDCHRSGLALFRQDGGAPATGNLVVNNTIVNAADARWALVIKNGSSGNTVLNNIIQSHHPSRGGIEITGDCLLGFTCDFGAHTEPFSLDDKWLSFAQWRSATGQDQNSFLATPAALFVNEAAHDYHLAPASPALDSGTATMAPAEDLAGDPRPAGLGYDIGAYEHQVCGGSSKVYGTGLAGSGGFVPTIDCTGCPTPGQQLVIEIDQALGGTQGVLFLGLAPASVPALGGTLLLVPTIQVFYAVAGGGAGQGTALFPIPIPPDPALLGVQTYWQSLYSDPGATHGVSFTSGLLLTIG